MKHEKFSSLLKASEVHHPVIHFQIDSQKAGESPLCPHLEWSGTSGSSATAVLLLRPHWVLFCFVLFLVLQFLLMFGRPGSFVAMLELSLVAGSGGRLFIAVDCLVVEHRL